MSAYTSPGWALLKSDALDEIADILGAGEDSLGELVERVRELARAAKPKREPEGLTGWLTRGRLDGWERWARHDLDLVWRLDYRQDGAIRLGVELPDHSGRIEWLAEPEALLLVNTFTLHAYADYLTHLHRAAARAAIQAPRLPGVA